MSCTRGLLGVIWITAWIVGTTVVVQDPALGIPKWGGAGLVALPFVLVGVANLLRRRRGTDTTAAKEADRLSQPPVAPADTEAWRRDFLECELPVADVLDRHRGLPLPVRKKAPAARPAPAPRTGIDWVEEKYSPFWKDAGKSIRARFDLAEIRRRVGSTPQAPKEGRPGRACMKCGGPIEPHRLLTCGACTRA